MAQGPPSSDSESDDSTPGNAAVYQYESEGEEMLGNSARALLREARGDYHREWFPYLCEPSLTSPSVARATILAYTR